MQTTGNLGLKKPEGTDIVDIADLNGNMDILDNAVTGKVDKVTGKQLSTNDYTAAEKNKLAGIATGATNYTHPATHPPAIIAQDSSNRFVTDAEKTTWNAKAGTAVVSTAANGLMSVADKILLNNNTGFGTTAGTGTAYTVTLSPTPTALVAGLRFSFISHIASGANPTLNANALGAKAIKKSNGNAAILALNGVYTVVYNGSAFILQGEGGEYGTATAAEVLAGKTIGTENGLVNGTMPDKRGIATDAVGVTLSGYDLYLNTPEGHYNSVSSIRVREDNLADPSNWRSDRTMFGKQGTMPVITSGEDPALSVGKWGDGSLAVYPREGYRKGGSGAGEIKVTTAQLRSVEGDLAPANIRSGVEVFGVTGTLVERMYAEGYTGAHYSNGVYQISGLSFKPRIVRFTFFKENSQSTFVYLGTDTERWNFVEYAGTNPYGTVISSGEMPSPSSWGNGFSAYLNFSGISVNILWNAWR